LASVEYDVYNADGEMLLQNGSLEPTSFDEQAFIYTRTDFECVRILLTEGTNTVVLHLTDLAGNESVHTLNYTVDLASDQTPPTVAISWPAPGDKVSGDWFTVEGTTDDTSAAVRAVIVGAAGAVEVAGVVLPSGRFYVESIPLAAGSSSLTVYAKDAAGNESQQALWLERAQVQLAVDDVAITPRAVLVDVSGFVSDPGKAVTVNGVAAVVAPDGHWTASNIPLEGDDPPRFLAVAFPAGQPGNPDASALTTEEHPPYSYLGEYALAFSWSSDPANSEYKAISMTLRWRGGDPADVANSWGQGEWLGTKRDGGTEQYVATWPQGHPKGEQRQYVNGQLVQTLELDRPPVERWVLTQERCSAEFDQRIGASRHRWKRTVRSQLWLFTGSRAQDRAQWCLMTDGAAVDFTPYVDESAPWLVALVPESAAYKYPAQSAPVPRPEIRIGRRRLDCSGMAFHAFKAQAHEKVAVKLRPGRKWFEFTAVPSWPPCLTLTRAHHPEIKGPRLEAVALDAAVRLGVDDDQRICDNRPGLTDPNNTDDVPKYIDFYISNDKLPKLFEGDFATATYEWVRSRDAAEALCRYSVAHIKQTGGITAQEFGNAYGFADGHIEDYMVLSKYGACGVIFAHEWMHSNGLTMGAHRGDPCAIMHVSARPGAGWQKEINRNEYQFIEDRP